jgi:hydroxyethylthiazole kinase-like uncharacterized protein yjeF
MKILDVNQIREADAYTILHQPISSIDLMERAAKEFVQKLLDIPALNRNTYFDVYCGPGNNGGDGLAIARLLVQKKYSVRVLLLPSEKYSADFTLNLNRLKELKADTLEIHEHVSGILPPAKAQHFTVIVDALFGIGLSKPLSGVAAEAVQHINAQKINVVAVDIPSGLPADKQLSPGDPCVKASYTLTFQQPKLSLLFADHAQYTGHLVVLPIGLHQAYLDTAPSCLNYVSRGMAIDLRSPRAKFSHKGNYGHALLVAGTTGKMGAAVLAVKACLRSGVGLVTARVPAAGTDILHISAPEAMVNPDEEQGFVSAIPVLDAFSAVGAGPGLGTDKQTQNALKLLIQQSSGALVLDADALNILSENKTWLSFLPPGTILTPHPTEFERLCGKKGNSFDRFEWQKEFSIKYKVVLVLKGAHTSISCPSGAVYFNSTGNPGMAKGGSGDVLTGLITGLLAQGYLSEEAAIFGVYLHGLAGDIAATHLSMEAMTAGDLVAAIGEAFLHLG